MTFGLVLAGLIALAGDAGATDADVMDGGAVDADADAAETGERPLAPPAAVPAHRLAGQVFARGSRRPVATATIVVGVTAVAETDAQGRFWADVPCGKRHVAVQAPRFDVAYVERDACVDASPLIVRLSPRDGGAVAYETVVRAPTTQPHIRLEGPELVRTPGTMGDPFRAVESLPGVAAVAWPAPIYAVRGANPGNTGFMLDDLRVPSLFHFALGPSVIHPYFFDRLDFYPGGYPARYGRSVGGLVSAQTRAAPADDVHASVDVRLLDAGAMVTAPLPGNGAVAVAGRYSYLGPVVGLLSSDVSLGYWDYQLRADRAFGPFKLTLLAFGSSDHLIPTPNANDPTAETRALVLRFHRAKLRAEAPLAGGRIVASVGVGSDHTQAPLADRVPLVMGAVTVLPRLAFTRTTTHADFTLGFDGEITRYQPTTAPVRVGLLDLTRARTARLFAGFASATLRLGTRLLVTPELRYDSYAVSGTRKADLGPRLGARLALTPRTSLTAMGGRFTQTPSLPLQIPGFDNFGLALFGLQTSWQGSLGVTTTRWFGLESSVTGYVQRYVLTDIRDPSLSDADLLSDYFLVRRDALSYGLEFLLRRPASEKLHGWLSYTLSNSLRAFGGGVIGPSDWDQRHILNLVLGYRIGRTTIGGRVHFNTGRPVAVTSSHGGYFDRLPPFYQVDLRADRRYVFDKFTLEFYVELVNATLTQQTFALSENGMPNQKPSGTGIRIVLPSIGVHGEF